MLFFRAACVLLLLPALVACSGSASNKDPVFEAKLQNEKRIGEQNITKRQIRDAEMIVETASHQMELLEISQIAQRKAASADAKYVAQNVINQVGTLLNELKALAQQKNLVLPTGLSESQAQQVGEMTALNGAAFDQKFGEALVNTLKQDTNTNEDLQTDSYDGDLRPLATRQLVVLQDLQRAADDLQGKLKP
ncbi:DUF4142 domain-containing protein [Hymenobacter psychrophilus]|uniref:Putative membrane protein n=1 Tax=Hymenobacter psychrophilus TaxID=651662 RepID=A0A1H3HWX5_9BACT|nr:DUF4142 domain-containing protein [Hymenobacter psychrophilus]SDY19967.1 putative membrane protein [Hymenobacter psychrophilus]